MSIVIFSGTSEGRIISDCLAEQKIKHHVCVATESGMEVMQANDFADIHVGRMQEDEMEKFLREIHAEKVIDATHPYAQIVTKTIKSVCEKAGYQYLRLVRGCGDSNFDDIKLQSYQDAKSCAEALKNTEGNIFLATGSKELKCYTEDKDLRDRLYVRVLPSIDAINLCQQAGIDEKHIIAMYGPHSEELNIATMRQYQIAHLVTKESGSPGGFSDKINAAREVGASVHLIIRPIEEEGVSLSECLNILGVKLQKAKIRVSLAGIGMGNPDTMTVAVRNTLSQADYVFGAKRLLDVYSGRAIKNALYKAEDIINYLEKEVTPEVSLSSGNLVGNEINIVVLFSGDTGIFSGASNLRKALVEWGKCDEIRVLPGISSFSAFSAELGADYKHAYLESLHGLSRNNEQLIRVKKLIADKEIVYLLMSGKADFKVLFSCIPEEYSDSVIIDVGYEISYENQEIFRLNYDSLKIFALDLGENDIMNMQDGLFIVRISF